jgi:hypothetical protein
MVYLAIYCKVAFQILIKSNAAGAGPARVLKKLPSHTHTL